MILWIFFTTNVADPLNCQTFQVWVNVKILSDYQNKMLDDLNSTNKI